MRRRPCSKRGEGRNTFRRQRVESRIFSPHECEVALLLHNGAAVPVASLALRGFSAESAMGFHHEVVRNASIVIETGLVKNNSCSEVSNDESFDSIVMMFCVSEPVLSEQNMSIPASSSV